MPEATQPPYSHTGVAPQIPPLLDLLKPDFDWYACTVFEPAFEVISALIREIRERSTIKVDIEKAGHKHRNYRKSAQFTADGSHVLTAYWGPKHATPEVLRKIGLDEDGTPEDVGRYLEGNTRNPSSFHRVKLPFLCRHHSARVPHSCCEPSRCLYRF